jgi:hypothetical protein
MLIIYLGTSFFNVTCVVTICALQILTWRLKKFSLIMGRNCARFGKYLVTALTSVLNKLENSFLRSLNSMDCSCTDCTFFNSVKLVGRYQ